MWTRSQLKERARADVNRSYWGLVLMSLIASFIDGISRGGSAGGSSYSNSTQSGVSTAGEPNWGLFLGLMIVVLFIVLVAMLFGMALRAFLINPIRLGATKYFIEAARGEKKAGDIGLVGYAFGCGYYKKIVKTLFLRDLYLFFWSLLFLIPGIVKSYEYAMIPYILAERPDLETREIFDLSRQMMTGEKFDTFILGLSFIGWEILALFTLGLVQLFYVGPYINMTNAELYEVLKWKVDWRNYTQRDYGMNYNNGYRRDFPVMVGDINYPQQQMDTDR